MKWLQVILVVAAVAATASAGLREFPAASPPPATEYISVACPNCKAMTLESTTTGCPEYRSGCCVMHWGYLCHTCGKVWIDDGASVVVTGGPVLDLSSWPGDTTAYTQSADTVFWYPPVDYVRITDSLIPQGGKQ